MDAPGWGDAASESPLAAIDLGTNNCRLLIARAQAPDGKLAIIDSFSRIVRLGEGVARVGALNERAMARAIAALRICADKMARCGARDYRAIATQACRIAANRSAFCERVRAETGLKIDVISAEEEARLAARGCVSLVDDHVTRVLVFDIGGGSTELALLTRDAAGALTLSDWSSIPCGVVTLAERHGGVVVPRSTYRLMVEEMAALMAPFRARIGGLDPDRAGLLLGTSGTVTTLAGVHLGLARYDRRRVDGLWMDVADVCAVREQLLDLDHVARASEPCIGVDRADLVIGGCAILDAILDAWSTARLRIADRGLREGVLFQLMAARDRATPAGALL